MLKALDGREVIVWNLLLCDGESTTDGNEAEEEEEGSVQDNSQPLSTPPKATTPTDKIRGLAVAAEPNTVPPQSHISSSPSSPPLPPLPTSSAS